MDLERQVEVLNRLVKVSLVMNSTLKIKPLLQFLMEAATDITDSEAASILLVDKYTSELRFAAATGSDTQKLAGIVVPLEGSIAGTVLTENRAIVIDDVHGDPRHFREVDERTAFRTRSILGVPMRLKDKLIGVLELLNKREGRYGEHDVQYATILASQAAVAIENAQLVAALRQAYEDLDRLNKLKNDFIAIASHELRTPLGVILGYATFLKEEAEGEASEHARKVFESALHLSSLIEGMTNLRYVDMDDSEFNIQIVSLNEILKSACNETLSLAEGKDQTMLYEEPDHTIEVRADRNMTLMALVNVLNNAVKFTPPGGLISISVEERRKEAWVRVRDNGIGIEADQLERIFDQFYQVEDPMTRRHSGLGLGLTIARALLERQGGRIWAESPGLKQGSMFTLAIPLAHPRSTDALDQGLIQGTAPLPDS